MYVCTQTCVCISESGLWPPRLGEEDVSKEVAHWELVGILIQSCDLGSQIKGGGAGSSKLHMSRL